MRVLWGPSAQPGSLFPAVPIVLELLRRGHEVTALCEPRSESNFRDFGCAFAPALRTGAVPPPARPLTRASKSEWWSAYAAALFADALERLRASKFDVVLADPLETGVDFAAETDGVPCCSYVHWGLDEVGADVPFCFHLWDREEPVDTAFANWWNGLRAASGLPAEGRPARVHRWYRTSQDLTLLLGLPELVHPRGELPPAVVRVGPTIWDPPEAEPLPEWLESVGNERTVILASVSTIGSSQDLEALTAIAEAADVLDLELVLTAPVNHVLPALPGHVRVARFVPHGKVLGKVAVFVNHAGNGSVNRAAVAGVPVLLLPTGRDQFQVARGASAAGLGITLPPGERDVETITAALSRLVDEPAFAQSARDLAATARTYHAAKTAADHIEELVR